MKKHKHFINRRHMLKKLGIGSMACMFSGVVSCSGSSDRAITGAATSAGIKKVDGPSEVSIVKGSDLRDITYEALMNIEDKVMASLEGKKRVLIKPNMVVTNVPLCATHVDSVRGILDFLRPRWKGPVTIGESTISSGGTMEGFSNYGYLPLEKEYGVNLYDMNESSYELRYMLGPDNVPLPIRIISDFLDKDQYIISAAKMKTHDRVLTTLALKNILLAAPYNDYKQNDKPIMHRTTERSKNSIIHFNMFSLAREIYPDLGVIDGFEAMEGNGPVRGTPVDARIALASLDSVALDSVTTKIMGFDPSQILYLTAMCDAGMGQADLDKIITLGADHGKLQIQFEPHPAMIDPFGLG